MPYSAWRQSPNIEDRRDEYDPIQHLLFAAGIGLPEHPDAAMRQHYGLEPGNWLDTSDPNAPLPVTDLSAQAGALDLDNQIQFGKLLAGK